MVILIMSLKLEYQCRHLFEGYGFFPEFMIINKEFVDESINFA